MTNARFEKRWFRMYFVSLFLGLFFASLILDGGVCLFLYMVLTIPSMIVSFILSRVSYVVRVFSLAILLALLPLALIMSAPSELPYHCIRWLQHAPPWKYLKPLRIAGEWG